MIRGLSLLIILALATSVEGAITVTARGTHASNAASVSTFNFSPTSSIASGSTGVMYLAADNAGGSGTSNTASTITDSKGNTWYQLINHINNIGANAGSEDTMYWAYLPTGLSTSDSVTAVFGSGSTPVTAKIAAFWELAPGSSNNRVLPVRNSGAGNQGLSQTAPIATTPPKVSVGQVVIGGLAAENAAVTFTDANNSTGGSWSASQSATVGTTTTGMALTTQYKIVTTVNQILYDPTLTSSDATWSAVAFAEVDKRVRGLGAQSSGAASLIVTPRIALAVNSIGVICVASDNSGGASATLPSGTFSDSASNTWTQRQTRNQANAANAGVEIGMYTAPITTTLPVTGSVTITFVTNPTTNYDWVLWEFAPTSGGTMSYVTGGTASGAANASPTVTTSSIANGDIVVGMGGDENNDGWVDDADTINGSWSIGAHTGFAAGTGGMAITTQAKTVTATATQTYNPTDSAGGTPDTMLAWIQLHETVSGVSQNSGFFQLLP
jgi:hypothetical protein